MRRLLLGLLLLPTPAWAGTYLLVWQYPAALQRQTTFVVRIQTVVNGVATQREQLLVLVWSGGGDRTIPPGGGGQGDICQDLTPAASLLQTNPAQPLCSLFTDDIDRNARPCPTGAWMVGACQGGIVTPPTTSPQTTCGMRPDLAADPNTMCAEICLNPGRYTLTVFAVRESGQRTPTQQLDADTTGTARCTPEPPPPSPRPGPRPRVPVPVPPWNPPSAPDAPAIAELPNMDCVTWQVDGVCMCNPTTPCTQISYYEPRFIAEVVKVPGTVVLSEVEGLLQAALSPFDTAQYGGGGATNATGSGNTNIHYGEVHIYPYPQVLGGPCTTCGSGLNIAVNYASEADSQAWKRSKAIQNPITTILNIGVWARLYPRQGKVIHGSQVVASAVQAIRGLNIAFQPIGTPPNVDTHIVLQPVDSYSQCIQLAYPKQSSCFDAGAPPFLWEHGATSIKGTYVFLMWVKRSCCVNPTNTTCGITLVGRQGGMQCLLPTAP